MFRSSTNRMYAIALFLIAFLLLLVPLGAFAATPDLGDPGSILNWLRVQAMFVTFVVTLVWKHFPLVKDFSNKAAGWLALLVFIVDQFAGGVGVAQAAVGPVAHNLHWTAKIALAVANFSLTKPIWDGLLKPTVGAWADSWLGRVPQTQHN